MEEAPEALAVEGLATSRGIDPRPDMRQGREVALEGELLAGRQRKIGEVAAELEEDRDEVPQGDGPARGPLGHGGAVDADPVGQVVLGPAEAEEPLIDPSADRPAADLRRCLLEAMRDRGGEVVIMVERELAEELAGDPLIGRVAGGPSLRGGRGRAAVFLGECPHHRLPPRARRNSSSRRT